MGRPARGAIGLAAALGLAAFSPTPWNDLALRPSDGYSTPALNAAAATACASATNRTVALSAGVFTFLTRPEPFGCALNLVGEGKGATRVVRGFSGGGFLTWQRGTDPSGGSLRDMNVEAGPATQGGIAVYILATPDTDGSRNSFNRHGFSIDNVQVGRVTTDSS